MEKQNRTVNFKVLEKISEGQFGTVFKAQHSITNDIVAIKQIFFNSSNVKSQSIVEREINILQQINDNNVLKLIDYKIKDSKAKIILEYLPYDLKQYIEETKQPLSEQKVKRIAYQIVKGLNAIHEKGFLHRDLKPSNILISQKSEIKIGDFGSAIPKLQQDQENQEQKEFSAEGFSRWYKSPEMLFGSRNYNEDVDIWSFACIYCELLQGYPMFPGNTEIDQIARISEILGSPSVENWPDIEQLPDYGKIIFKYSKPKDLQEIFPTATKSQLNFLQSIFKYQNRLSAKQLLEHDYFVNDEPKLVLKNKPLELNNRFQDEQFYDYFQVLKQQNNQ